MVVLTQWIILKRNSSSPFIFTFCNVCSTRF